MKTEMLLSVPSDNGVVHAIESGIPIPARKKRGNVVETLLKMNVGDSVVIPKSRTTTWHSCAKFCKLKVVTRIISKTEARVWRVDVNDPALL